MNKNSGMILTFHSLQISFLLLLLAQTVVTQICIKYSGNICDECATNYQLLNGECVSLSPSIIASSPTLIFQDSFGSPKMLYGVNPVVVLVQSGNSIKSREQNIVNQFQVSKVFHPILGNYYVVNANKTVLNDNISFPNSSILQEINQNNLTQAIYQTNHHSSSNDHTSQNLTAVNQQINFIQIPQIRAESYLTPNLTQIKQKLQQINLTKVGYVANQVSPQLTKVGQADLSLIVQKVNEVVLADNLTQIKQFNMTDNQSIQNSNQLQQQANLTVLTGNKNNLDFLIQLQQINQKLTKANQIIDSPTLAQAKFNPVSKPSLPSAETTNSSDNNQTIDLYLTQIGQKLTPINQKLIQAQFIKPSQKPLANQTIQTQSQPIESQNKSLVVLNLSKFIIPAQNYPNTSQLIGINWIKATRYELYNLTYIPQISQAKFKQNKNTATIFTFQCTQHISIFQPISSNGMYLSYAIYAKNLTAQLANQYKDFTISDRSTLCLDPPFHQSYKYLTNKYKSVLNDAPLFAAFYQFCGFAKIFRIFFIDDSNYPSIIIRQGVVMVDLFRMVPAEVVFWKYEETILE